MENEEETLVILIPGMQSFVRALKEISPELNVIVLALQYPFFVGEYQWHGIRVISVGGKEKGKFYRVITWAKTWLILKKLNKRHNVIGLLSFWLGECAFVGNYFAKMHMLGYYCWLVGQDVKKGNKYFNLIKPKGDSLIAMSDFLAKQCKINYNVSPVHVVPFGLDASLFDAALSKRDIDVLGAGSLIPLKQYHLFVDTIYFLKNFIPDIKAVICGNGPERERLLAMVKALGLEKNISFTGELPHQQVLALMQRARVFLHPSNYEGFSTVLSEALYAGAHVVSFCKPMEKGFRHHYVVKTNEEMNAEVLTILQIKKTDHQPVLVYPVQQTAKNIISLFAC
jgi:glycosyltransferase involved in cell wall biosynthesis